MKRLLLLIFLLGSLESFSQSPDYVSIINSDSDKYVPMTINSAVPSHCLKFISFITPDSSTTYLKNWSESSSSGRMKCTANLFTFLFDSKGNNLEIREVLSDMELYSLYYDVEDALIGFGYYEDFDYLICYHQGDKIWYEATNDTEVVRLNQELDTILE